MLIPSSLLYNINSSRVALVPPPLAPVNCGSSFLVEVQFLSKDIRDNCILSSLNVKLYIEICIMVYIHAYMHIYIHAYMRASTKSIAEQTLVSENECI